MAVPLPAMQSYARRAIADQRTHWMRDHLISFARVQAKMAKNRKIVQLQYIQ